MADVVDPDDVLTREESALVSKARRDVSSAPEKT